MTSISRPQDSSAGPTSPPAAGAGRVRTVVAALNGRYHRPALIVFTAIVLAHWAEHIAQAVQIWGLGWARPKAGGVLGVFFPWLVKSEWLHFGYAVVMLAGLWLLLPGFVGRARRLWRLALGIQIWHTCEHLLLLTQALTGVYLAGRAVPTSVLQLLFPRVELHLFYNLIVFVPMVAAMWLHLRPTAAERAAAPCRCAVTTVPEPAFA